MRPPETVSSYHIYFLLHCLIKTQQRHQQQTEALICCLNADGAAVMRGISGLLLLLLLPVCSSQGDYMGAVLTYTPRNPNADGSISQVVYQYNRNFRSCNNNVWSPCVNCTYVGSGFFYSVYSSIDFCQTEETWIGHYPRAFVFQNGWSENTWISNINNVTSGRTTFYIDLRNRSDTGRANTSPQTNILPEVRVPSNCQRDFRLLAFDPDGDDVKCRYGLSSQSECDDCTQPSVLSLSSSSCTLSFSPTSSSNEGSYVVQLVMEDFPRQTITLTHTNGTQTTRTVNDAISKIPVQFVVTVDAAAPSCTEGLYLPRFLPPTPANGAQLFTAVNQTLEISISAEANNSQIGDLLFSRPYNVTQTTLGNGHFSLRWTPSGISEGVSHSICFAVQTSGTNYQSELRCVTVSVGIINTTTTLPPTTTTTPAPTTTPSVSKSSVVFLAMRISTSSPLSAADTDVIIQQLKDKLVQQGLPPDIALRILNIDALP